MNAPYTLRQAIADKFNLDMFNQTSGTNHSADFYLNDSRVMLTKIRGGYRVQFRDVIVIKSSMQAAVNFVAKNI